MGNLANIYLFRDGRYHNLERGVLLALMGADLGGEIAMNELGLCYENGYGVPLCEEKAFEWVSKAVENGAGACAEHNLARFYRKGIGTKVDKDRADELDRIAAEHGWKKHTKTK
jgi:TPR repeat protein